MPLRPIMLDSSPQQIADTEWKLYKEELARRQTLKKAESEIAKPSNLSAAEIAWQKKCALRKAFIL